MRPDYDGLAIGHLHSRACERAGGHTVFPGSTVKVVKANAVTLPRSCTAGRSLSSGAIAGIVVGGVAVLAGVVAVALRW